MPTRNDEENYFADPNNHKAKQTCYSTKYPCKAVFSMLIYKHKRTFVLKSEISTQFSYSEIITHIV